MYILKQLLLGVVAASTASVVGAAPSRHHSSSNNNNNHHQQQLLQAPQANHQQDQQQQQPLHHQDRVNTTKYFHEPGGGLELGHYDARFFRGEVAYEEHRTVLRHLIRSYLTTMEDLRVETWLAHGTLLGWWWNGQVMPWDYDLDVQVTMSTLHYLGKHFNRTLHTYTYRDDEAATAAAANSTDDDDDASKTNTNNTTTSQSQFQPKQYLLDINPYYAEPSRQDGRNVIDARWIDTSNGMFIDITSLLEQRFADTLGPAPGIWSCKNYHHYATTDLWPLRRSEFEGVPARVPFGFDPILRGEYGPRSMRETVWQGHQWQPGRKEWVKIPVEEEGDAVVQ
ncbi:Protein MNN4 [Apiospora rasikravindrae]|uniref:Protein MNN4 n=1 Tax=Apiospora rasikravindrae TaxID=990691 RepID=A0ABR1SWG0_9PEZI